MKSARAGGRRRATSPAAARGRPAAARRRRTGCRYAKARTGPIARRRGSRCAPRRRGARRERIGNAGGERSEGAGDRAGEVVPGEEGGAVLRGGGFRQDRLLGRQEQRDVAGAGIERADEGDEEKGPEAGGQVEGDPGRAHQRRRSEQDRAPREAVSEHSDGEQQRGRPEEGGGGDGADLHRRESEPRQVAGKEHAGDAVGHSARGAGRDQPDGVRRGRRRKQAPHRATCARAPEALQVLRPAVLKIILRIGWIAPCFVERRDTHRHPGRQPQRREERPLRRAHRQVRHRLELPRHHRRGDARLGHARQAALARDGHARARTTCPDVARTSRSPATSC